MPIQQENGFYATGRRKESTARVWVKEGSGTIVVNGRPLDEYFGRETSKMILNQPLQILEQVGKVDVTVNVVGGGLSGQAGAIRHGLSRALCLLNPEFRNRAEEGRLPHPRRPRGGAEEVRPARRPASVPVQQALVAAPHRALEDQMWSAGVPPGRNRRSRPPVRCAAPRLM